jgi:subtilase family serine protease
MLRTRRRAPFVRVTAAGLAVGALPLAGMLTAAPALAATATTTASATATASTAARTPLTDTHPSWATSSSDAGAVASSALQTARVYLAGTDPAGLVTYATSVSTPGSADYQHFLTPQQFQTRFGATTAQQNAVANWLTSTGLHVTTVTAHYIGFSGSASAVQSAFRTTLHAYRTSTGTEQAPATAVSVPAALAPDVLTITGLTTTTAKMTSDVQADPQNPSSPINVGTCSTYYGQKKASTLPPAYGSTLTYDMCGYDPAQLRSAYGVNDSNLTGRGVTVAVVDGQADPTLEQDLNTYSSAHGLPALRPGQFTENLPSDITTSCPPTNAYIEQSLDVEAVHTMAPAANLVYVGSDCTAITDPLDAETRIVDNHLADIVSDSWHLGVEQQLPSDLLTAFDQVMEQGAVEGIGFYFSSGDHGDWSRVTPGNVPAVQYPGSDPWVTSVGGTSLAVDRQGRYLWEDGWGTTLAPLSSDGTSWVGLPGTFAGGSGGGRSAVFAQPFYQRGIVPGSLSTATGSSTPMREMPDIAADADAATGMLIGLTATLTPGAAPQYVEGKVGGTSLATPLIAGIQADAQQAEGGIPLGFANPAIYARYHSPTYHDVTSDPLGLGVTVAFVDEERDISTGATADFADTTGYDQSLAATRGYDDITGVGTPTRFYLETYRRR